MSDNRINHYYPAAIMAYGFSKEPQMGRLRESKVNVIIVPKLINLLLSFAIDIVGRY